MLIGASLLSGWAGPGLRHNGGPALLAVTGLVWATGFWWLTMQILLAGRLTWRAQFPAAWATGVLYIAMQMVFSLVFSAMVISDEHIYGPIGTIFAVLSYLIATASWSSSARSPAAPGTSAHQARARPASYPLPCRPQLPPHARVQGPGDGHMPLPIPGRLAVPGTKTHGAPAAAG